MVMNISTNIAISLVGIVNLALASSDIEPMTTSIVTGSVSVGIGIIKMVQEQFNWSSLASDYKNSAMKWDRITRKIEEQVVLPYLGRKDCGTFLKYIKQDINEASDTNTILPKDIRNQCNHTFGHIPDFDVPDICGQVEHTSVYVEQPTSTLQVPLLISNTIRANHAGADTNTPPGVVHPSEPA